MEKMRLKYLPRMARTFLGHRRHFASTKDWLAFGCLRVARDRGPLAGVDRLWLRPAGFGRPVILRPGTTDYLVFREIFIDGEYDSLRRLPVVGFRTVLDLGANIGLFTRLALQLFEGARIAAVEPEARNADILSENVAAAADSERVSVIRACAAGIPRRVGLATGAGEWGFQMVDAQAGEAGITAMRVPDILDRAGFQGELDLLKCDVEGAEAEIFSNCSDWINRVRHIVVEIHAPYSVLALQSDIERNGGNFRTVERIESSGLPSLVLLERT